MSDDKDKGPMQATYQPKTGEVVQYQTEGMPEPAQGTVIGQTDILTKVRHADGSTRSLANRLTWFGPVTPVTTDAPRQARAPKTCPDCGQDYTPTGTYCPRCPACARARKLAKKRAQNSRYRATHAQSPTGRAETPPAAPTPAAEPARPAPPAVNADCHPVDQDGMAEHVATAQQPATDTPRLARSAAARRVLRCAAVRAAVLRSAADEIDQFAEELADMFEDDAQLPRGAAE
jgi:hypothetical protein